MSTTLLDPRLGIEQCIGSNKFCWDFVFFWTTFGDVIILILLYIDAFYIYSYSCLKFKILQISLSFRPTALKLLEIDFPA